MALRSHYKGPWIGKAPMCAICAGAGVGARAEHHLTHGVSVWLCEGHRSEWFQRQRGGRDFVESLAAVWRAAGIKSTRHQAALRAHLRRARPAKTPRARPGSYSWPGLRRQAEQRFQAGEDPRRVIEELRRAHGRGPALVPTVRTMRRWFAEARWFSTPPPPRAGGREATADRLRARSDPHPHRDRPTGSRRTTGRAPTRDRDPPTTAG